MRCLEAEVVQVKNLWGNFFLLKIEGPFSPSSPGQFAMISPSHSLEPFLRRPFGIAMQKGSQITFLIKRIGRGTSLLREKKPGEKIGVITPLGKGFSPPQGKVLLVGGGTGIVPIIYLANKIKGYTLLYGAKSRDEVFLEEFPFVEENAEEIIVVTEDGSMGEKGLLTQFIPKEGFSMAYVSGPWAMMEEFRRLYKGKAEFSLETRMGCGFGVCYGCVVKIRRGKEVKMVRACVDGPVFKGEEIVWKQG